MDAPTSGEAPRMTMHVPVLMYHHVLPPSLIKADEPFPDLFVDPARFDAQMAALQAGGWHAITARQLAAAVHSGRGVPPRSVVITFDDGRPDNYTYAFPILKRYGFVATFFIVPGRIGTGGHMTACQLREIAAAGNELADHTWNHCDLTTLNLEQARSRIRSAADSIESLVSVRPDTIAYPYGRYDGNVEAAADAEGMLMAFTTEHGAQESVQSRLAEPRLRVQGLVRRADGTYGGGTSAQGLLWLVSPYSGS
jgi:peptidoglycan/xylan/chitin deacetylase (PgdA/CDA1 family)